MKLESLNDLFLEELADLHSAETQLVKALPKMANAANDARLRSTFLEHLRETETQLERLNSILARTAHKPSKTCKAMHGLIDEGAEMAKKRGDPAVIDAGLIGAAQRVEHYEIAAYGCARTYAELLGDAQAAESLETSLNEEKAADEKLNTLAEEIVNPQAARAV